MANNCSCGKPAKFVNCCDVMNCVNIKSSDNTVNVTNGECGVDLTINPNTLNNILQVNNGTCITWTKNFVDGKLVLTPVLDWNCIASHICSICNPATCPAPISLRIVTGSSVIGDDSFPYGFPFSF